MHPTSSFYDDWQEALCDWNNISPSELHGMITALVCAITPPSVDEWGLLFDELSLSQPSQEALAFLTESAKDIGFELSDPDDAYEYAPLLPDDDCPLDERLLALKDWAGGFMTGIGMADVALSQDDTKLLGDLGKIAALRVDIQDDDAHHDRSDDTSNDDTDEPAQDKQDEVYYFELYEFVRMVPLVFAARPKKQPRQLALIKGLDMGRKTAQEHNLPPVIDALHKH